MAEVPDEVRTNALPLFVFDGRCGFCRKWASWLRRRAHPSLRFVPFDELPDPDRHGLTPEDLQAASFLVDEAGERHRGSAGFAEAFKRSRGLWPLVGMLGAAPGLRAVAGWVYERVARNRHRLPAPADDEAH